MTKKAIVALRPKLVLHQRYGLCKCFLKLSPGCELDGVQLHPVTIAGRLQLASDGANVPQIIETNVRQITEPIKSAFHYEIDDTIPEGMVAVCYFDSNYELKKAGHLQKDIAENMNIKYQNPFKAF